MEASQFCHSCSMPLSDQSRRGETNFCVYCTDDDGALKSREAVRQGIQRWLRSWQPGLSESEIAERADHFMKAMPAWATN